MAYIRVVYKTKDRDFDYVPTDLLGTMITRDEITHFYRPSEKKWVSIKFDPVRGTGAEGSYQGPERRMGDNNLRLEVQKRERSIREKRESNWLESLWRHIETS